LVERCPHQSQQSGPVRRELAIQNPAGNCECELDDVLLRLVPQPRPCIYEFLDGSRQPFEGCLELGRSLLPAARFSLLHAPLISRLYPFVQLPFEVANARFGVLPLRAARSRRERSLHRWRTVLRRGGPNRGLAAHQTPMKSRCHGASSSLYTTYCSPTVPLRLIAPS